MAKKQQHTEVSKTLRVTVSGSYRGSNKNTESFDSVTGVIPRLDPDKVDQMVIRRYALVWVQNAKKKDEAGNLVPRYSGFQKMRTVYIDSIDDTLMPEFDKDGKAIPGKFTDEPDMRDLSYVGKSIMDMNFEELQDLASANDLSGIPLYRNGGLTEARRKAFSEYAIKILDLFEEATPSAALRQGAKSTNRYDWRTPGFNPNKFEPIEADDEVRRQAAPADVEDQLDEINEKMQRVKTGDPKQDNAESSTRLTLQNLKDIADSKNISYNKNIGYAELHKKIYGVKAA